MFGYVAYHEAGAAEPPVRRIASVRFQTVYVLRGDGLRARLSARFAARSLARQGVRQAVFPEAYAWRGIFERRGVSPVSPVPLYRATAAAIVRRYMARRGVEPHRATVAFAAERTSPELYRAVTALAAEVRYVVLAVPSGGEELARRLKRELGVAARLTLPTEAPCADLTVAFSPVPAAGDVLALYDPALKVEYADALPTPLLAALWSMGAVDAGSVQVSEIGPSMSGNTV